MTLHRSSGHTGRLAPVALLTVAALVLTACRGTAATPGEGYISGDGVIEQIAGEDRRTLPPIAGGLLDGGLYDSRDHRRPLCQAEVRHPDRCGVT